MRLHFLLATLFTLVSGTTGASQFAKGDSNVIARFRVLNDGDAILIPVAVGGGTYVFYVDTACTRVIYDTSLMPFLGDVKERLISQTLTGPQPRELFDAPDAFIGRLSLRMTPPTETPRVICQDLTLTRLASGHNVRGSLGMHFLQRHIIQLDFDRGELTFLRAAPANAGVRLPIDYRSGFHQIRAILPGVGPTSFVASTGGGWNSGFLETRLINDLVRRKLATVVRVGSLVEGTQVARTRVVRVSSLTLAEFTHSGLLFAEDSGNRGNALGLGYLRRFIVTLDFPAGAMYLKPGKWFNAPDHDYFGAVEATGMGIGRIDGEAVIRYVNPSTPARRAGVHKLDVLLAVNGTDVTQARLFTIYQLFFAAKNPIQLTVDRGGERLDLSMELPRAAASQVRTATLKGQR